MRALSARPGRWQGLAAGALGLALVALDGGAGGCPRTVRRIGVRLAINCVEALAKRCQRLQQFGSGCDQAGV
ncbi:MAG: hypothetical protein ACO21B_10665, partial [Gemmobacter sp.]